MKSAFNPKTGTWEINWPGRVSRHDLAYLTPPDDPLHGMPIGNGEVGALCWFEGSKIMMVVNKSDLWDDAEFGRFHNWDQGEEEHSTTLRHGGRIMIDFKAPVFDLLYLSDCRGRLSLADACVHLAVSGPFGSVTFKAFVNHSDNTLCCDIQSDMKEDTPIDITVERYGSRMFHHWYCVLKSNPAHTQAVVEGTSASTDSKGMYVSHQLTGGKFALGTRVLAPRDIQVSYQRESSHHSTCRLSGKSKKSFSLLAAVTSPLAGDPVPEVKKALDTAEVKGPAVMFSEHTQIWKNLWLRSLMETGHDFLDNVWHLLMYYALSSQGGRYPGRFIGGLWNHMRDFQAWGFYFHWNQQQMYWPLNAAGHHDLVAPYLNWRFEALPNSKKDARELFGVDGAIVSDVVERRGYNSEPEMNNHTPVAQIAMDFWRQYQFTGDETFLRRYALPYMIEAAKYFETLFVKEEDGIYHGNKGSGYEGGTDIRDCVTEIACARAIFPAVLEALRITGQQEDHAAKWRDIIDHLAPFMTVRQEKDVIKREFPHWKYARGVYKGEPALSDRILAAGFVIEEGSVQPSLVPYEPEELYIGDGTTPNCVHHDKPELRIDTFLRKMARGENPFIPWVPHMWAFGPIFPFVEYAAIFPSGVLGLSGAKTDLFKAAVNTAKLFAGILNGWDPVSVVMARLGLSREMYQYLDRSVDNSPMFPNGLFADCQPECVGVDGPLTLRSFHVWDKDSDPIDRRVHLPLKYFRHIGMEYPSILACALNESLLQSHDGILRVAPAADKTCSARFTLHAVGGFVVSGETENGSPRWVHVESRLGKTCKLANPWSRACLFRNGSFERDFDTPILEFQMKPGEKAMIVPDRKVMSEWQIEPLEYARNEDAKFSPQKINILGLPRMF